VLQAAGSLVSIAILLAAGASPTRRGQLPERATDGLKALITQLTLPLLLFRAFLQLEPDANNAVLALAVFAACAVRGGIGVLATRAMRLPSPETRLLFQGFEAGMLGYAFFVALHGAGLLPAFAALDMGQVVYVFTVLIVQMSIREQHRAPELRVAGRPLGALVDNADAAEPAASAGADASASSSADLAHRVTFPWRDIASSKVLWAIAGVLMISIVAPGFARTLAGRDRFTAAIFDTVGGLTTPLVCLVIGASLAAGIPRDPAIVRIVALRTLAGLSVGPVFELLIVPQLGFSAWHTQAAIMLFVLPAPFAIPVYYKRNAAFLGGVLTLSTAVSIVVIAVLAVLGVA